MSFCKSFGKDKVIFATKEDHATPSTIELPETEASPGLILESGEINWSCPCLGGMATGPCGVEFREAFSCFHFSEAQPKGSDCYDAFKIMQDCMANYPGVYKQTQPEDDDDEGGGGGLDLGALVDEAEDPEKESLKEDEPSNQSEIAGAGTSATVAQKDN
ncbi:mitochondrial intermembrane space import and assembly protein 40-B [Toxorhynchites rutilus septentrionalis]|uniref:mitochondrial intermembrane space import and assembly protein 40-B n=1 Tax=Toxorhynchites rutilus septentrionalis TaxID=329112 RepID=UPI0024796676|nr:mitochondrial intermembrane space import and assembly protein 40-B [Toxorhynchites rutilus septentrionalis]